MVRGGNAIDVSRRGLTVGVVAETGAATTRARLLGHATGTFGALLEGDRLRNSLVVGPKRLETFVNGRPRVGPLERAHLPRVVDLLVNLYNSAMIILKRHFYKELHEGQFIGQFMIQLFFWSLGRNLQKHSVHELMKGEVQQRLGSGGAGPRWWARRWTGTQGLVRQGNYNPIPSARVNTLPKQP